MVHQTYSELLEEYVVFDLVMGVMTVDGKEFEVTPKKLDDPMNYPPAFQEFVSTVEWLNDYEGRGFATRYTSPEYPSRIRRPRA